MKKFFLLVLAAGMFAACQQQQVPRSIIEKEVPTYNIIKKAPTKKAKKNKKKKNKRAKKAKDTVEVTMVKVTGPEALEWDMFDRGDAVMKYNEMPLKDKEILFETIARVYAYLPEDNTLSSEDINTGIWKEVTDKGVDLSFGKDPADWHPYLMYIHPVVIAEMTNFFLLAKEGSITNEELDEWQKAACNLINARPDVFSMAALLNRREELAKAGIILTETEDGYKAETEEIDWDAYRAERSPQEQP